MGCVGRVGTDPASMAVSQRPNELITRMLTIISSIANETSAESPPASHPNAIAAAPTRADAVPYANASIIEMVAPAERCCQKAESSPKPAATMVQAKATMTTGRDGNGFTLRSLPTESSSQCQPGKVDNRPVVTRAKIMEMKLF